MIKINNPKNDKKAILKEFIPENEKITQFNNKPVITHQNTGYFYFKTYKNKEIWLLIKKNQENYYHYPKNHP